MGRDLALSLGGRPEATEAGQGCGGASTSCALRRTVREGGVVVVVRIRDTSPGAGSDHLTVAWQLLPGLYCAGRSGGGRGGPVWVGGSPGCCSLPGLSTPWVASCLGVRSQKLQRWSAPSLLWGGLGETLTRG